MGQKESPEPNLHVCCEDGTQRVIYKLKEEHAKKGDRNIRERKKAQTEQENVKKSKRTVSITKTKRSLCQL